jgi:hypothetical protein
MSTELIIAIVVAALILLALLVLLPRMRGAAQRKKAERELHDRRRTVAEEHRSEAAQRQERADLAERQARVAQQTAERDRAEANLQQERAELHERGLADHELVDEGERDRFQGVMGGGTRDADGDGHTLDDRARAATGRDEEPASGSVSSDYQQGREDERSRITDDVRRTDRPGG